MTRIGRFENTRWAVDRAGLNISEKDAEDAEREMAAAEALISEMLEAAKEAMNAARRHLNIERENIPIEEAALIYDVGKALREAIAKAEGGEE